MALGLPEGMIASDGYREEMLARIGLDKRQVLDLNGSEIRL